MVFRNRAGGIARGTQNTIGGVIKNHPFFLGLDALLFFGHVIIDKVGLDRPKFLEEFRLVHDQIALHGKIPQRFNGNGIASLGR